MPKEAKYHGYSVMLSVPATEFRKRMKRLTAAVSYATGEPVTQGDVLEMLVGEAEAKYKVVVK